MFIFSRVRDIKKMSKKTRNEMPLVSDAVVLTVRARVIFQERNVNNSAVTPLPKRVVRQ